MSDDPQFQTYFQHILKKNILPIIWQVINKVLFEMSEEGKEIPNKSQDERVPLRITVNRPFLFTIVEGNTNAILMLGRILNPNQ